MAMTRKQKLEKARALEEVMGPDRSVIEFEFGDGWTIRRCLTYGDMCREGELMSNCWANSFWHKPNNQRAHPYGAGMNDEHFKGNYKNQNIHVHPELVIQPTRWHFSRKLKRTRYFSLRDKDNIPRISFFGNPGTGKVISPNGAHNCGVKPTFTKYLRKFQEAKGHAIHWSLG